MENDVQIVTLPGQISEAKEQGSLHNLVEDIGNAEDIADGCGRPCSAVINYSSTPESVEKSQSLVMNDVEVTLKETYGRDVRLANVFTASEDLVTCNTRKQIEVDSMKVCESPAANSNCIKENADISLSVVHDRVRTMPTNHLDEELEHVETHCRKLRKIGESAGVCLNCTVDETKTMFRAVHESIGNTCADHSAEDPVHGGLKKSNPEVQNTGSQLLIEIVKAAPPEEDASGVSSKDETGDAWKTCSPDEPADRQSQMTIEETVPLAADDYTSKDEISPANREIVFMPQERPVSLSSRKKLLVLDVNGLLADIVFLDGPCEYKPDTIISSKAVFTRPFYRDFLDFCFTHFNVGIWTSRMRKNVEFILDFLLGELKQKLLFCWDQSHCTDSGFVTVEDRQKPLIIKELKKLWEKHDPNLPWERGEFNESNTLLLDDTPHKALCNPPYTAIFPQSFRYTDMNDTSLSPEGELRAYLKGLAEAENVQKYVQENPYGQRPITERNLSWRYYQKVIAACSSSSESTSNTYASYHWKANQSSSLEAAPYRHASYHWRDSCPSTSSDAPRRYENYHQISNHSSSPLEPAPYRHGIDCWKDDNSSSEAAPYGRRSYHWKANNSSSFSEATPYGRGRYHSEAYNCSSSEATSYRQKSYHWKATDSSSSEARADGSGSYHGTASCFPSSSEAIPDRRRSYHWTAMHASSFSEAISGRHGSYHWTATHKSSSSEAISDRRGSYHWKANYMSSSSDVIFYPRRSYHWRAYNSSSSSDGSCYRNGSDHREANG